MHVDVLVRDICYWDFFEISPFPMINNRHKFQGQRKRGARVSKDNLHGDEYFAACCTCYFDVYLYEFCANVGKMYVKPLH